MALWPTSDDPAVQFLLDREAIGRIKEAVITDLAASRPRSQTLADFEQRVRERMDALVPVNGESPAMH